MDQEPAAASLADRLRALEDEDEPAAFDAVLAELRHPEVYGTALRHATVDVVAAYPVGLRREERRSWWLGVALAGRIAAAPETALAHARERLAFLRTRYDRGPIVDDFDAWERLLDGPVAGVLAVLTSPAADALRLRSNSPWAGLLSEDERQSILAEWRAQDVDPQP